MRLTSAQLSMRSELRHSAGRSDRSSLCKLACLCSPILYSVNSIPETCRSDKDHGTMLTVAQLGATGYMGSGFSKGLLKASRANALRYVILHRPGADLSRYPQDVEKRVIDIEGGVQDVRDALSGVQVVM